MKIDISAINQDEFLVTDHIIGGQECIFVRPLPTFFDWRPDVLHFRSSIWLKRDGSLVSGSYKKFFNFEEKPAIDPFNGELSNTTVIEKLDGSTLIVSRFGGETIMRTRGTVDARLAMLNGDEVEYFRQEKFRYFFATFESMDYQDKTVLFEWVSPRNRIILDYGTEPDLYLTNIVNHHDYSLTPQKQLDEMAPAMGFKRPKLFNFPSIKAMLTDVKALEGYEGVCMYYNNDQNIRKVKGTQYLRLHAFKSNLSLKNLAELLYHYNVPKTAEEFLGIIEKEYDFECAQAAKPVVRDMWSILESFVTDIANVGTFVITHKDLDQKSFALKIMSDFKDKKYLTAFGFSMRRDAFNMNDTKKAFLDLLSDANTQK
jgi:hypothetical protein